jgi:hypothetical protein
MKTNGAVGNAMLPVALFAANSSSPPIRKTNERVSHAASVTCIRRAHHKIDFSHRMGGPIAKSTSRTSLGGGENARPNSAN